MSMGPLYVFFGEVSIEVLWPFFKNWIVCISGVELYKFFIYFWKLTSYQMYHWQICSPMQWVPFSFC